MSAALFDLIILWSPDESDLDYVELQNLLHTEFPTQFITNSFTKTQAAINHIQSRKHAPQPLIIITKLGKNNESLGEPLIKTVRQYDKHTFIVLHSHEACTEPDYR